MNSRKKILSAILACSLIISIAAGCSENTEPNSTTTAANTTTTTANTTANNDGGETTTAGDDSDEANVTEAKEEVPAKATKDLGGKSFIVGNWWSNSDDFDPQTSYDDAVLAQRIRVQELNNMTIKNVQLCGWGEMQELASTSILSGDPAAHVFMLEPNWAMALFRQNLVYPVSDVKSVDWTQEKWNKLLAEAWTFSGKTYGFATSYEPRGGVFWNKRLFEEAGIDPMLPYDLQASGEWSWAKFTELCELLTRDNDNDGIKDTYAITTFSNAAMASALYSNNAKYIGRNDEGQFYNATTEPQFIETMNFVRSWEEKGYRLPDPEGSEWNYFESAFNEGKAAMRISEFYDAGNLKKNMADDFGFVYFPYGPSNTEKKLISAYHENTGIVPITYSPEEVEDIMFAYDWWTDPVPGYEDDDSWKINQYAVFSDERAVDETIASMRLGEDGVHMIDQYFVRLPGDGVGNISWNVWTLDRTCQEIIETVMTAWNTVIDQTNALISE